MDPTRLLRHPGPVEPYPVEPSDEALAEQIGIPVSRILRFDMNTLAGGPLPGAVTGLGAYDPARLAEYGDQALARLREAVGRLIGVSGRRVLPGAGADELIRLVTTNVVGPGDSVVVPTPTFAMFAVEARLAGASVVEVERGHPGRRQPAAELRHAAEAAGARLVWICSPNNPTADAYPIQEIRALADGLAAVVVVDAVYQEFAEASDGLASESLSVAPLQEELSNLIVLRSLAKSYGLAGARVGYLVLPDQLADRFEAARLPLPIGGPSEAAALGALEDPAEARRRHAEVVGERDRLAEALRGRGWSPLPSVTNFLLAEPPPGIEASRLAAELLSRGMALRSYEAGLLAGWLRITVRTPADDDRLLAAIDTLGARAG